ncbi:Uncharacterized protein APZ42_005100 [Daphnia magna]|uniref:Uncharacterized protein n=1 Tax=Daphnia magna TaxID=35525 RepID=A0A164GNB4_9CRUS|nr:Uncharacterized protein APZ42_005100 [Daphnia magna]
MLCSIHGYKESKVVIIGIYHGLKKPANVNDFLSDFVCEAIKVLQEGLKYDGRVLEVQIAALVCYAPARCMVTSAVSHNGYFSCHKCETKEVWARTVLSACGGRVEYPEVNAPLRSDASVRAGSQAGHHNIKKERSIIEKLPIDLVKAVPIDYMNNVCIGVQKSCYAFVFIKEYCPVKFPRKTRTLDDFPHLKANEHRNHLLYFLPVALKGVISKKIRQYVVELFFSFKRFTHAWQNLRDNERTLEAFRTRLISEQRSLNLEVATQRSNNQEITTTIPPPPTTPAVNGEANAALFGQYGNKGNNSRSGRYQGGRNRSNTDRESKNRSEAIYSYCGKHYHYRFECKQRIANESVKPEHNKRRREDDDNPPPGPSHHKSEISLVSPCYFIEPSLGDFFLDSGCSRHKSNERSYFKDLRLLPPNS